ncbi:hypothetical protein QF026_004314 [Streptomyces aurantiacus]|uniref:DUF7660 family protein n=1 Tax=Streptomyces aurantiacus TaxID=47760 RepID=UPI00279190C4|nr:hypothetical protein [Streptomyces aurantiacus]MDQ0775848.1 hypothetical protein [Streptomyces aurantiacus]
MTNLLTPNDHIADREALCAFLTRLRAEYDENGAEWENQTLDTFLEALDAWVSSAPGWYANHGQALPAEGDWTFFARALSAARHYE